jgi:HAD superfamily hydrolase (TIGR01509 family)
LERSIINHQSLSGWFIMIDAIVFDFDGLIIDTEIADFLSWQKMYAEFGVELPLDVWHANIGVSNAFDPYLHLEELLGYPIDRPTVHDRRKQWDNEFIAQQTILPGVETVLNDARRMGLKIGLASSSDHAWVDGFLDKLGLAGWFEVVRCSDDVDGRSKPDPAVYLSVVAGLGVPANRALALEDSPNGLAAAKAAGLYCTAVPNQMTRSLNFDQADLCLESLAQMPLAQIIDEVLKNGQG